MKVKKPWTVYPSRPLSQVPPEIEAWLGPDFERLKQAFRAAGIKLYDYIGLVKGADPDFINYEDLLRTEMSDLVVSIHAYPSDGVGGEISWKSQLREHVIAAAPKGRYVSAMSQGYGSRNPNFRFVEYNDILELVPIVVTHFNSRTDDPKDPVAAFRRYIGSGTNPALDQNTTMPIAT